MNYKLLDYPEKLKKISRDTLSKSFILIDTLYMKNKGFKDAYNDLINYNILGAKGIIQLEYKKLIYVPSQIEQKFPIVKISREVIPDSLKSITVKIKNIYKKEYHTRNIIGFIEGELDSFIVFSAHYDHLGEMGEGVYFPGANDNGSGITMVLNLARHFSRLKKKPKYSIAFMFFSAEEIGLLGSTYYVNNPIFPLSKIKFLINLDMVGSGDRGISFSIQALTNKKPGSEIAGVPASETKATVSPFDNCSINLFTVLCSLFKLCEYIFLLIS